MSSAISPRRARRVVAAAVVAGLLGIAVPARASEHDPEKSGHPLRVGAYFLHPVGVALDWLIFRPAHWVVQREPFRTLFGHVEE